jgi:hypothetical protein
MDGTRMSHEDNFGILNGEEEQGCRELLGIATPLHRLSNQVGRGSGTTCWWMDKVKLSLSGSDGDRNGDGATWATCRTMSTTPQLRGWCHALALFPTVQGEGDRSIMAGSSSQHDITIGMNIA